MPSRVDFKIVDPHHRRGARFQDFGACRPPKNGLHPGQENPRTKGLGDIIIRSHLQPGHHIRFIPLGGHHDDRDPFGSAVFLQDLAHLQPVHARQHQVQQDQVRPQSSGPRYRVRPGRHRFHPVAVSSQVVPQQLDDIFFVFDNQNSLFCHSRYSLQRLAKPFPQDRVWILRNYC